MDRRRAGRTETKTGGDGDRYRDEDEDGRPDGGTRERAWSTGPAGPRLKNSTEERRNGSRTLPSQFTAEFFRLDSSGAEESHTRPASRPASISIGVSIIISTITARNRLGWSASLAWPERNRTPIRQ